MVLEKGGFSDDDCLIVGKVCLLIDFHWRCVNFVCNIAAENRLFKRLTIKHLQKNDPAKIQK
jgi:hypothetical protein